MNADLVSKPKIALLVPTRSRPSLQMRLVSSLILTTSDIDAVQLIFGIDADDPQHSMSYRIADATNFVQMVEIKNDGKFMGLGHCWNCCWKAVDPEIDVIAMIGDDMIFRTVGWDEKIRAEFSGDSLPPDKLKMVYCDDGHRHDALAVNAFLHRRYAEINGYFMREEFRINWVDQWLHQVFNSFGRLKYLPDVLIEHDHWIFKKRSIDETGARMMKADENGFSDRMWYRTAQERLEEIRRIERAVGLTADLSKVDLIDDNGRRVG